MSEETENGLDLAAVRERFLEAEEKLRELAEAAVNLKTGSVQLKRARMGVVDASKVLEETTGTFAEYLSELAGFSERLSRATDFVEQIEPTATLKAVRELDGRLKVVLPELEGHVAEVRTELGGELAETRGELGALLSAAERELGGRLGGAREELGGELDRTRAELSGRLDAVEASLTAADRESREAIERGIIASADRLGESIDTLEAALSERVRAATEALAEAERSLDQRLDRADEAMRAVLAEEAAAGRQERRRLRLLIWLLIALEVLVLAGLALLL